MDPTALLAAVKAHQYILAIALVVGSLVALAKQGWFSQFVAAKMPARALPYYAVVLGVLGSVATQVQQGVSLSTAIVNGIIAGAVAVTGHNVVVEGFRGGAELIPEKKAGPPAVDPAGK